MVDRLAGKTAVVTGAGAGIGRAIARAYAREGANVLAADLDLAAVGETVELIAAAGGQASSCPVDVLIPEQIAAMIATAIERMGRIDVLHNNAGGVAWSYGTILDIDVELWDRVHAFNVRSVYLGCKYALPHMLGQGRGTIVNTASIGGLVAGFGLGTYGASKAAVIQLTKAIAIDFADKGIRANAICPGSIATEAMVRMFSRAEDPVEARRQQAAGVPMLRLGEPEEIANLAVFLASDESSYVTGAAFVADGGYTAK